MQPPAREAALAPPPAAEAGVVAALRAGDEAAFARLVDEQSPGLMRLARQYVAGKAEAEEAVQETWIAVIRGIDGFEGGSSLKAWIYGILINRAKTRGQSDPHHPVLVGLRRPRRSRRARARARPLPRGRPRQVAHALGPGADGLA